MTHLAMAWFVAALWAANCLFDDLRDRDRIGIVITGIGVLACIAAAVIAL